MSIVPMPPRKARAQLVGGVGLGAAVVVLGTSALYHTTGYQAAPEEIVAAQTIVSYLLGRLIRDDEPTDSGPITENKNDSTKTR